MEERRGRGKPPLNWNSNLKGCNGKSMAEFSWKAFDPQGWKREVLS